jgi:hypothetical protein
MQIAAFHNVFTCGVELRLEVQLDHVALHMCAYSNKLYVQTAVDYMSGGRGTAGLLMLEQVH